MDTKTNEIETYNRLEEFVPTEFAWIDYERSWKKCRCGRVTGFRDNWCPGCGQKLGFPILND